MMTDCDDSHRGRPQLLAGGRVGLGANGPDAEPDDAPGLRLAQSAPLSGAHDDPRSSGPPSVIEGIHNRRTARQ
jgi:hypothetical protein